MAKVEIVNGSRHSVLDVEAGLSLLQAIQAAGISTSFPCGGNGRCGKCRVIAHGSISEVDGRERSWLSGHDEEQLIRLACYARVQGDCKIEVIERAADAVVETAFSPWDGDLQPLYSNGYGVAIDIGTTTIATQLFRPESKYPVAVLGELNRQQMYGGDVISRIVHCNKQTVAPLSELVRGQLGDMLQRLCAQVGASPAEIRQLTIAGNTTMLYILFGIEPAPLAVAPFVMTEGFDGIFDAKLDGFSGVPCLVPGCSSAYIGADITCSVLASNIMNKRGNILLVDAGTNGEMVLSVQGDLRCCSTAAGPAFEGAGISCGGNASLGAIDSVQYREGTFSFTTIGNAPANKLCGSGLIDAVAALLQAELVNQKGKLRIESGMFFLGDSQVFISQKDIRQLQLAKAAIRAGMDTLIHESGLAYEEIDQIILCGGFGSYLRPASAERIGLIPPDFAKKTVAIGNAAGNGAGQILQSVHKRGEATEIVRRMETVELATNPYFNSRYIETLIF
ncbi:MAG: ASKHA domain-containing protein [Candidatus Pelethousia sp.]|nr:ASKHA domain-containing protein [Candidatus Pelethousia sp.]